MSFNRVAKEQGHLRVRVGRSGTHELGGLDEPGQDARGFSALAAFPRPGCPGVGMSVAVHGCPPLGIELAVGLQVQPTAAGPGVHGFTPPKEQRGRLTPRGPVLLHRDTHRQVQGAPTVVPGQAGCGGAGHTWLVCQDLWQVTAL